MTNEIMIERTSEAVGALCGIGGLILFAVIFFVVGYLVIQGCTKLSNKVIGESATNKAMLVLTALAVLYGALYKKYNKQHRRKY